MRTLAERWKLVGLIALVSVLFMPGLVSAAPDIGEMADKVSGQFDAIIPMAIKAGFVIGIFLAVGGVYLIYKDTKQPGQDHMKKGVVGLVAGGLLLALPLLVDTTQKSVGYDSNPSAKFLRVD